MLRFLTAGESHGPSLTAILEGMPAGMPLNGEHIDRELARRQQGYGSGSGNLLVYRAKQDWIGYDTFSYTANHEFRQAVANAPSSTTPLRHEFSFVKSAPEQRVTAESSARPVSCDSGAPNSSAAMGFAVNTMPCISVIRMPSAVELRIAARRSRPLATC